MKNFKKLVSIMLALVMAAAMALIPALAAEDDQTAPTPTYEIYQIFTGKVEGTGDDQTFSDAKYGANINADAIKALKGTDGITEDDVANVAPEQPVAKRVMDYFENLKAKGENERAAALYAFVTGAPVATAERDGAKPVTVRDDAIVPGYYLIKDQEGSQPVDGNYTLYVVEVMSADNNTIVINPKVGTPEPDKVIVEDDGEKKNNDAAVGDTVNYKITGTMPGNLDQYNTYYYEFVDTLSKGLTYNEDMTVFVDGNEITGGYTHEFTVNDDGSTTIKVVFVDVKAIAGVNADTEITLTYSAELNAQAEYKNDNDVKIVYSNDPNKSGTPGNPDEDAPKGETPKKTVSTYTTQLKLNKVDQDGNALTGVEFTLTGENLNKVVLKQAEVFVEAEDGTYYLLADGTYTTEEPTDETADKYADTTVKYAKVNTSEYVYEAVESKSVVATVNDEGVIVFYGLKAGTYTLTETKTPEGYNTIKPVSFEIKFDEATGKFTVVMDADNDETDGVTKSITANENGSELSTTIENKKGSLLPSTGGIGTTIFYVVGSVLVAGAVVLLVVKSKKRSAKAN